MSFDLLPDQTTLINSARDKIRGGCKSLLIQGATGSGKTVIASEIIAGAYRKEKVCFFVVPRRDLLRQTSQTLQDFGIPHSFIAAGMRCNPKSRIFVCSTATLRNRMAIIPDIAIIDETHYGGEGLDKIIATYKAAGVIILGLSATPWRLSGKGLGCWYDDMVCGPTIRWLIDNKRLAQYRAFAPSTPDLSRIKITGGDYNHGQLSDRMEQDRVLIGNAVKHYKQHAIGKLGVTFAVSIKHSQLLAESYRDAGIPAMHMDGETPEDDRIRIARAFAKRELLQLCNAELLTFGYDLASASGVKGVCIQSMTDCQPTMSLAKQHQKNGRNLRYDIEPHTFFDHANNFREHGLPDDPIEWTLQDRVKTKRGESERTIPTRTCPKCYFCFPPASVCPNCAFVFPVDSRKITEVEGELEEIDSIKRTKKQAQEIRRKAERMEVGMAKTIDDLRKIASERKYHHGWIRRQMVLKGIRA